MLRFARPECLPVGSGQHRSGWPYALRSLQPLAGRQGLLFDDFVERSFSYDCLRRPYREPWAGIFHHPPDVPEFAGPMHRLQEIFTSRLWRQCAGRLVAAVALSEHLASYLREELGVPVAVALHPTEFPSLRWSARRYEENPDKQLAQVGWYLRNTRAIHQVPDTRGLRRVRLSIHGANHRAYDERVIGHWRRDGSRREVAPADERPYLPHDEYDRLFAENVILTEVFDSSANNVVVECLARQTPLVVNRHPAVVQYVGADYPLLFDRIEEVPQLLCTERLLAAHRHLARLDRSRLSGETFRESIQRTLAGIEILRPAPRKARPLRRPRIDAPS